MSPAIRYAEEGFVVDAALAQSLQSNWRLISEFGGAEPFGPYRGTEGVGKTLRRPELAATLRRIAEQGAAGFYSGPTADAIAEEMRLDGGIITKEDRAKYQPVCREPVVSTYRGYTLYTMPPSSSGGVTVTETLNILEGYRSLPPFGSTRWAHLLGSAY